ncbi:MAG: 3-deoxy-manno-octulosonate cytidylyltransferase [Proteobacteria bacterium]|nr:3-deoxy-manno-octulosonate cytidylyltransferase [Pseudomonadota bacterium]
MSQLDICVIPARMGSSRFPNKPLIPILGMPMIGHVALRCKLEPVFSRVVVATCDQVVMDYCKSIDVEAIMTSDKHERASDRIQEAVVKIETKEKIKFNSVTMVQGDEPMVTPQMLRLAVDGLKKTKSVVLNLKGKIKSKEEFRSPNCVKVVTDLHSNAIYFSREPIPSPSKFKGEPVSWKQVCVIPFDRDFLDKYSSLKPTYLEEVESIDMNRVLEHGYKVHMVDIEDESYPVDVVEDLVRVEAALKQCPLVSKYMGKKFTSS